MKVNLLVPRRSPEEREKNHIIAINKMIQEYIKNGSQGDLDLRNSPIEILPDNLIKVDGGLNLANSKIKDLNNLKEVTNSLWLTYSRIKDLNNLKSVGSLIVKNTLLKSLPNNLKILYNLNMEVSLIERLPDNLEIRGNLYLKNTQIKEFPEDLKVGGKIWITNTPLFHNEDLINKYKNMGYKLQSSHWSSFQQSNDII